MDIPYKRNNFLITEALHVRTTETHLAIRYKIGREEGEGEEEAEGEEEVQCSKTDKHSFPKAEEMAPTFFTHTETEYRSLRSYISMIES